jgi:two-component system, NarL family, sensor kinase
MKTPLLLVLGCTIFLNAFSQMENLSDQEKVVYINKNFYRLYSADLPKSLGLAKWAAEKAATNNWFQEEAQAQMWWGVATYLTGDYQNVLPKYLRSLQLFEKLNDQAGIVAVNNEMGVFYHKQNDLINCFKSLDRAEKLAREINDLEKLGANLGHRGAILSRRNRLAEARPYYEEVFEIRKKTNDSVGLGYVLLDLAELAANDGKADKAINYIDQSTAIRKSIKDFSGLAVNAVTKGEAYMSFNMWDNAIRWLEEGIAQGRRVGYADLVRSGHKDLSYCYRQIKDFEKALYHFENSSVIKDSLLTAQKAKTINELQIQYETEKKEMQLADQETQLTQSRWLIGLLAAIVVLTLIIFWVLRKQSINRQKQRLAEQEKEFQKKITESVIELQEKERARFAKDLHDGFGQLISSVRLYVNNSSESWKQAANETLDQMHSEIRNIAFALLPRTLVEEGIVVSLNELSSRLSGASTIQLYVSSNTTDRLDQRTEVSLYRICQEWINNIIKYADANSIHINLLQTETDCTLTIEDNGNGFNPDVLTDGKGNGWKNIQSRLSLLNGRVLVESNPERKGTILTIEVPLKGLPLLKVA